MGAASSIISEAAAGMQNFEATFLLLHCTGRAGEQYFSRAISYIPDLVAPAPPPPLSQMDASKGRVVLSCGLMAALPE